MLNKLKLVPRNVASWGDNLVAMVNAIKWPSEWSTRCQTCKEVLFEGRPDPLKKHESGMGGWYGAPIAVCLGSWRNRWQRRWYHQSCCGIDSDKRNLAGRWQVFGFTPSDVQNRMKGLITPSPVPSGPVFSSKIGPPLQYPTRTADRQRRN